MEQFVNIVKADPAVDSIAGFAGGGSGNTNTAISFISLKPLSERKMSADEVIDRLRPKLSVVPGATLFMQAVAGDSRGRPHEQRAIPVHAFRRHVEGSERMVAETAGRYESFRNCAMSIRISRRRACESTWLSIATRRLVSASPPQHRSTTRLYDAFGQRQVSTMYTRLNQYHVVMEVELPFQQTRRR